MIKEILFADAIANGRTSVTAKILNSIKKILLWAFVLILSFILNFCQKLDEKKTSSKTVPHYTQEDITNAPKAIIVREP